MGCSVRKVRSLWIGGWGVGIRMVRCFHRPYLHRFSRPFPFFHPCIHHPGLQAVSHHAALSPFTQIRSWRIRTPWTQKRGGLKKKWWRGKNWPCLRSVLGITTFSSSPAAMWGIFFLFSPPKKDRHTWDRWLFESAASGLSNPWKPLAL